MSTEENVRVVKEFFAAMGGSNKQDMLALVADDIAWIIPGEDWPLAGTHRGHAELADVIRRASAEIEMTYPEPPEFMAQGDRVFVIGVATGKIIARTSRSGTSGSSTSPFAMVKWRASRNISTRRHWPAPPPRRSPSAQEIRPQTAAICAPHDAARHAFTRCLKRRRFQCTINPRRPS